MYIKQNSVLNEIRLIISTSVTFVCLLLLFNFCILEHKHHGNSVTNEHTVQIGDAAKYDVLRKCGNYPWLIEPDDESGSFLFLKTKGYELPSQRRKHEHYQCSTPSRIIIYSGFDPRHPRVICPINIQDQLGHPLVEIFSSGWNGSTHEAKAMDSLSRSFIVEFTSPEHSSTTYTVSWLAVSKRPSHLSSSLIVPCLYRWVKRIAYSTRCVGNRDTHPVVSVSEARKFLLFFVLHIRRVRCVDARNWMRVLVQRCGAITSNTALPVSTRTI